MRYIELVCECCGKKYMYKVSNCCSHSCGNRGKGSPKGQPKPRKHAAPSIAMDTIKKERKVFTLPSSK